MYDLIYFIIFIIIVAVGKIMNRGKPRFERRISDNMEQNNVESYLAQYKLTDIPNPSDDSDFEDTSYEADLLYEKEKMQRKKQEAENKLVLDAERKRNAERYYQKYKDNIDSIFNLRGIDFECYTHKIVKFKYSPSAFSQKFICSHRKFHISLVYVNSWWNIRRFHVPNKNDILKIFRGNYITDEKLHYAVFQIHDSLVKWTYDRINSNKEKYEKFLRNEEIELNSDDEKLFLSPETRKRRKEHVNKIWSRMLPPGSTNNSGFNNTNSSDDIYID